MTSLCFGPIEIENFKVLGSEETHAFPHPSIKLTNGKLPANAQNLHHDHLGSVRAITNPAGARVEATVYKPYGERVPTVTALQPESKGWIGERFDPETGLQYLNARTYDPELGLFLQPDWWEVTKPGVGTNRYGYSFGDPVNLSDPNGNYGGPADNGRPPARDGVPGLSFGEQRAGWRSNDFDWSREGGTNVISIGGGYMSYRDYDAIMASGGLVQAGDGPQEAPTGNPKGFTYANLSFIKANPHLKAIWGHPQFPEVLRTTLALSGYPTDAPRSRHEVSAWITITDGKMSAVYHEPKLGPIAGTLHADTGNLRGATYGGHLHSHPAVGIKGPNGYAVAAPSDTDVETAKTKGPGFTVGSDLRVWGYDMTGYQIQ